MKAIYGVKLKEEKFPPIDLPSVVGLSFFKLQLADSYVWDEIKEEKKVVIKMKDKALYESLDVTLYALPVTDGSV